MWVEREEGEVSLQVEKKKKKKKRTKNEMYFLHCCFLYASIHINKFILKDKTKI